MAAPQPTAEEIELARARKPPKRAREFKRLLGLPTVQGLQGAGGVLAAPGRWFAHDRGWTLVYSAAIAGWSYLAAWGFLRWMLVDSAQTVAAVTGFAVGFLVVTGLGRNTGRARRPRAPSRRAGSTAGSPPSVDPAYAPGVGALGSVCQSPKSLPSGSVQVANQPIPGTASPRWRSRRARRHARSRR